MTETDSRCTYTQVSFRPKEKEENGWLCCKWERGRKENKRGEYPNRKKKKRKRRMIKKKKKKKEKKKKKKEKKKKKKKKKKSRFQCFMSHM